MLCKEYNKGVVRGLEESKVTREEKFRTFYFLVEVNYDDEY